MDEKISHCSQENLQIIISSSEAASESPFSLLKIAAFKIPLINIIMYFVSKLERKFWSKDTGTQILLKTSMRLGGRNVCFECVHFIQSRVFKGARFHCPRAPALAKALLSAPCEQSVKSRSLPSRYPWATLWNQSLL